MDIFITSLQVVLESRLPLCRLVINCPHVVSEAELAIFFRQFQQVIEVQWFVAPEIPADLLSQTIRAWFYLETDNALME